MEVGHSPKILCPFQRRITHIESQTLWKLHAQFVNQAAPLVPNCAQVLGSITDFTFFLYYLQLCGP